MSFLNRTFDSPNDQPVGKNGGVISKATAKRLNQASVARPSSVTSAQLNKDVPLIRVARIPSINFDVVKNTSPESPPSPLPNVGNRSTSTPKANPRKFLVRQKPIEVTKPIAVPREKPSPSCAQIPTIRKLSVPVSSKTPISSVTGSSPSTRSPSGRTKSNKTLLTNLLKKPKSYPDLSTAPKPRRPSIIAAVSANNNNNNPKAINRNIASRSTVAIDRATPAGSSVELKAKVKPLRSLESLTRTTNRGQGPSGSKHSASGQQQQSSNTNNHQSIKGASSVSSLDGLGLSKSSKSSKNHSGSKDKLDQNFKSSKDKLDRGGSKERITDIPGVDHTLSGHHHHHHHQQQHQQHQLQSLPLLTASGQQQNHQQQASKKKKNSPMPIIHQHVVANNNLIDQRDVADYHHNHNTTANDNKNLTRDLADFGAFDGAKEANLDLQQAIMQELKSHLERLTREKMALETKIVELSSYQTEVFQLRNEIAKLQNMQEKSSTEIQKLTEENETLRNRLRDVVNSPLSDAEKHQIIQDSQRLHSSAPASIALPNNQEIDGTPCVTPDWDKHSSSSEVSVACLQDKIIQMEETHYSTNEELQATLQELADLQSQLTELQTYNERLAEEKDVLFQSLCRQTEKLEDSRSQIGTLQELLLRESNQQDISSTEREQKLLELLKNAQEEREGLLLKQEELNSDLNELRQSLDQGTGENSRLRERISLLDSTFDAATAERKQIESQLLQAKEEASEKQIEISHLTKLLDNARGKIEELEQDRAMGDKSDLGELLDVARKEKDLLEIQVASLQEQVSKSQCEIQKLRDQLASITEECKVARNNAKCALSDLEYKYETLKDEKFKLSQEYQQLQDSTNELQIQCKCHLEDKAQLEGLLSEAQRHLGETERLLAEKEEQLQDEIKLRKQEAEEWEQFQSDLLMTVRVANDFKTEAQSAREQLVMDNKAQREKIRMLEQQIEKLNKQVSTDTQQSLLNTVQQEMAARRQKVGITRQDSRLSVKSLIESIENTNKPSKSGGPGSRCSSSSSLNSVTSEAINGTTISTTAPTTPTANQNGTNRSSINCGDWADSVTQQNQLHPPVVTGLQAKSPLREQQQTAGSNLTLNGSQKSLITDIGKSKPSSLLLSTNNNNSSSNNNLISTATTISASTTANNINSSSILNNNNNNTTNTTTTTSSSYNTPLGRVCAKQQTVDDPCVTSILSQKTMDFVRRNSYGDISERKDPLNALVKNGGSKRNALLKWCQNKTVGYRNIDITNFSSSWNDGLAFCAILHSYLPDRVPYDTLGPNNKRRNFSIAFSAAESVGIPTSLNINEMCQLERPDWTQVMTYVTAIYKHFET